MSKYTRIFIIFLCFILSILLFTNLDFAKSASGPINHAANSSNNLQDVTASAVIEISEVDMVTRDFDYDKNNDTLYVSVSDIDANYANSIVPIQVPTLTVGSPIVVGNEPNRLEISEDSSTLYVGIDGDGAVRRVDLNSGTANLQFSLGSDFCGTFMVDDLVIPENAPETVIISRRNSGCSPRHEGVAVYDDGAMRPATTNDHTGSNVIEPSDIVTKLYGYNNETTEFGFRHLSVDDQGIYEDSVTGGLISGFSVDIKYHDGRIYTTSGLVIDPATDTVIGNYGANGPLALDPVNNRVFFATDDNDNSFSLKLFEMNSFQLITTIPIPQINSYDPSYMKKLEYLQPNLLALRTIENELFILKIIELNETVLLPVVVKDICFGPFIDDFSNPASGWPTNNSGPTILSYLNGQYNMNNQTQDRWTAVTRGDTWHNSDLVQVEGHITSGEGVWGLLFGLNDDWSDFYSFEILPDDRIWAIFHYTNSNGWSLVTNNTSSQILTGGTMNTLLINEINNNFYFRINGSLMFTMAQREGRVGLTGGSFTSNTTIRYDNYIFAQCPITTNRAGGFHADASIDQTRPTKDLLTSGD